MEKTNPPNIKEIKRYSSLYRQVIREWNRLSPSSKFYYYHGVVYEDEISWSSYVRLVDGHDRLYRLRNKIKAFITHKEYKELGFMTWIKEACSNRGLIDKGAYKFRVPELCQVEKVKRDVCQLPPPLWGR